MSVNIDPLATPETAIGDLCVLFGWLIVMTAHDLISCLGVV